MSIDGRYILRYDHFPYLSPTPMEKDKTFLQENYGGKFIEIGSEFDLFWDKPKYTLSEEDLLMLKADQVLESEDGNNWVDITKTTTN